MTRYRDLYGIEKARIARLVCVWYEFGLLTQEEIRAKLRETENIRMGKGAIHDIFEREGVSTAGPTRERRNMRNLRLIERELRTLCYDKTKFAAEIADHFGVSTSTLRGWKRRLGMGPQVVNQGLTGEQVEERRAHYVDLYHRQGLTLKEIGRIEGSTWRSMQKKFKRLGIKTRQAHYKKEKEREDMRPILYELYVGQGLSQIQIAKRYGVSPGTVGSWLEKLGIPRRTARGAALTRIRRQRIGGVNANSV